MPERLQKILARAGVASRRAAEELILAGRVSVNGEVVRELGTKADPITDAVAVDGRFLSAPSPSVYLMLNKPAGYVTTASDPEGRPTVYELVPEIAGLFTVGRLDLMTEGLLIFTTDGDWAERIAHPRYHVEREYEVHVRGDVSRGAMEWLREGIMLDGKLARPVAADEVRREGSTSVLRVVMLEGRRHEVRLICAGVGLSVRQLIRRRYGPLLLGWLAQGQWRYLDAREVTALSAGSVRVGSVREAPGLPRGGGAGRAR